MTTDPAHPSGLVYGDRCSPVDAYLVELDPSPAFDSGTPGAATALNPNPSLSGALVSVLHRPGLLPSPRVANATAAQWFEATVPGLAPGTRYHARVTARNGMGLGLRRPADPRALAPHTAPLQIDLGGVSLSTVPASRGAVSVLDSAQSLLVMFQVRGPAPRGLRFFLFASLRILPPPPFFYSLSFYPFRLLVL